MRSKIKKLYDYRQVELPETVYIEGVKRRMDREISTLCKKFKRIEEVGSIEKGDVVTLSLKSEKPRFNREKLKLNVGSGLFDADFEAQLIGLKVGETEVLKSGEEVVEVKVLESRRSIYPKLTDEIVAEGMMREEYNEPDIKTVEQYMPALHDDVFEVLCDERLRDESERLMREVTARSEVEYDEEEIAVLVGEALESLEEELKEEGRSLDTMSEEAYRVSYSGFGYEVSNKEELKKALAEMFRQSVVSKAISCQLDGKDFDSLPFEEIEETAWEVFYNYIKEKIIFIEKED